MYLLNFFLHPCREECVHCIQCTVSQGLRETCIVKDGLNEMHEIANEALNAWIFLSLLLYQFLSHTYILVLLHIWVSCAHKLCYFVQRVHALMCPKWLNRILLSLKCVYPTKRNYCMTCVQGVFTSWYVLKYYRQFYNCFCKLGLFWKEYS